MVRPCRRLRCGLGAPMTRAQLVARLRAALPGWSVTERPPPTGWTTLDGWPVRDPWRLDIQPPGYGDADEAAMLEPRTRRYGVRRSWGTSWYSEPFPGGRGWPERFAASITPPVRQ